VRELGAGPHTLDVHADADHNRSVVTLAAASADELVEELVAKVALALERIDLVSHRGVHPRVGAADVIPIVPLAGAGMEQAVAAARRLGRRLWRELGLPVFYYAEAGSGRKLAELRRGGSSPDEGGPALHPRAGAVCVGARRPLVAYNIAFTGISEPVLQRLVPGMRRLPGVQALAFPLSGGRVQLSMNLTALDATAVGQAYAAATQLAGQQGTPELVGLCPAAAAGPGCDGGLLEARLAAAGAAAGAAAARRRGDEEHERLAVRLAAEAQSLKALGGDQEAVLGGAERALALIRLLRAAHLAESQSEALLWAASTGFREAFSRETLSGAEPRVALVDRWLGELGGAPP
jgi:glutamate formiminotransferase / 5-formyltetrahydrofolate cyclo-ligase